MTDSTAPQPEASIDDLGNLLAQHLGYRRHTGRSAVHWYILRRFRWPLDYVRGLSDDDLVFLIAEKVAALFQEMKESGEYPDLFEDENVT